MNKNLWLIYGLVTTAFWGLWGALIEIPEKAGFPATLGYVVWAFTMIPPALVAMKLINWRLDLDRKSVLWGSVVGLLGAGGQLILFQVLRTGPAYLVFPIISLSPAVTILLAMVFLKERATLLGYAGVILALVAIPMLSYSEPSAAGSGYLWIVLTLAVFLAWGLQAYVMKFANEHMKAESMFFYMMATALALAPIALFMTDFNQPINWGFEGPGLAFIIQILNSIGALTIVYAFRHGKAMIVSPLTNVGAPVITISLSLLMHQVIPHTIVLCGMAVALIASFFMIMGAEAEDSTTQAIKDHAS